jgi:hypothetical protein
LESEALLASGSAAALQSRKVFRGRKRERFSLSLTFFFRKVYGAAKLDVSVLIIAIAIPYIRE